MYVRNLVILTFFIFKGKVATRLRCGGKYDECFVSSLLLSTVKER